MNLNILYEPAESSTEISSCLIPVSGEGKSRDEQLLHEHMLEIAINEVPAWEVVCSPGMLPELVLGRLLSEGIIRGTEDVDLLYLCSDGLRAKVFMKQGMPGYHGQQKLQQAPEVVSTCCTGTRTIAELFTHGKEPEGLQPIPYRKEWITKLVSAFFAGTPIYRQTHCSHSAFLMQDGEILVQAEDIGRHNALDKVFGWALLHEIPLGSCIVFTSGRIPVDMTMKVIRAGVPVLVSKAQPTDRAVELAEAYNLTMIGSAHADSFRIYHGPAPEA